MLNNKSLLKNYMSWVMRIGQSVHYIQAWKIFTNKSAVDISLLAYSICVLLLLHWLIYGFMVKDRVIIIAESLGLVGSILVIIGILIYAP